MAADKPAVALLQFAREPVVGSVKTRMMPQLTPEQACALHSDLVLRVNRVLLASRLGAVQLWVTANPEHALFRQCRHSGTATVRVQQGADLGARMYNALCRGLACVDRVLLVGSDCPAMDTPYLARAVRALDDVPVVIGPALDGGYVLLGCRAEVPAIFDGVNWGSTRVYRQTCAALRARGLEWAELPALADVDRPEDLFAWRQLQREDVIEPGQGAV